jgi:long-chain acyl-CoA synthetase
MATGLSTTPIVGLPEARASTAPNGPCIANEHHSLTNAAFAEQVRRGAGLLRSHGVGRGDVVALALPNRLELIISLFAAWRLGAVVTPINPALTQDEMRYQLDDSAARLLIGPASGTISSLDPEAIAASSDPSELPTLTNADDLALLIYTSGTTGRPKGVMLNHANLAAMCDGMVRALELTASDHSLLVLPLFHVNGICVGTLSPLLAGGRVTVAERFSPSTFLDLLATVRPTYFSAVPAMYAMLSALPEGTAPDTSSLRLVVCGAAPMPTELITRIEQRFGVALLEGYGLSEATCASTINPLRGPRKPGTVGLPIGNQRVVVLGPAGRPLPPGERGEVAIAGPTVMRGYLNRPEETAKVMRDGWLHTGDVGVLDDDGYLRLVDRLKDMIIRGGENIYPKEIETALYTHDAVLEAAVIGRPDQVLGEIVVAYVSLRPGAEATTADLLATCERHLARYKRPAAIVIVSELPKNPVGKIDKPALRVRGDTRQ